MGEEQGGPGVSWRRRAALWREEFPIQAMAPLVTSAIGVCDCGGENKDTPQSLRCLPAPLCAEELPFPNRRVCALMLFPVCFGNTGGS